MMTPCIRPLGLVILLLPVGQPSQQHDEWSASPEAVFLTADERKEWNRLDSAPAREEFKRQYWRRRDPTPETDRNEFEELVRDRIATADTRYALKGTPGSRSERGRVFVLLGPPAAERIVAGPVDSTPTVEFNRLILPRAALDAREWHTWVYDRDKTPDVVRAVGRHVLEIAFVVQPGKRDELQSATLLAAVRRKVAGASVVHESATRPVR
jgi:GWxTD domain-containing protein